MQPFVVSFPDADVPDLPVFAESETDALTLGRQEAIAELGDAARTSAPAMTVAAADVHQGTVQVDVYLTDPAAADERIRSCVPATFNTDQMRLGSGEIVCDAPDEGPAVYKVTVPVEVVIGGDEPPEDRIEDAKSLIESCVR